MKLFRKITLLMVAIMATTVAYGQDSLMIRVMTFNMRYGERASLEDFAKFIKKQSPDFVALQEADCRNYRTATPQHNGRDFIAELARQTGMFGLFGKAIDFAGGYYGVGILSKYPYIAMKKTMLPNPKGNEQRVVLEAVFELPCDTIVMACTHLDYEYPEVIEEQSEFLCAHFARYKMPVIIAGDFNATPGDRAIITMSQNWNGISGNLPTYPTEAPDKKLDYIFVDTRHNWETVNVEIPQISLSDHLPVVCKLLLTKP